MNSPAQDSIFASETLQPKLTEQDVIQQIKAELLALIRVAPDEMLENWQKAPVRFGDWSNTLENEICHLLW